MCLMDSAEYPAAIYRVKDKTEQGDVRDMPEMQIPEVTRLRIREFNKMKAGGGTRLIKCEACGKLTGRGIIIDRDTVEEGASGRLEKTGYERWTLCPECAGKIMEQSSVFIEGTLEEIHRLVK